MEKYLTSTTTAFGGGETLKRMARSEQSYYVLVCIFVVCTEFISPICFDASGLFCLFECMYGLLDESFVQKGTHHCCKNVTSR